MRIEKFRGAADPGKDDKKESVAALFHTFNIVFGSVALGLLLETLELPFKG